MCETGASTCLADAGESAGLVIRGEAGIGKTALLEYAAASAGAFTVLRTTGFEAEADLAFAGVYGLVRPILEHLDEVPEIQSRALAGALGLAPSDAPDRFMVSAAILSLLAAAAEERPILCLVDDAQWLDRPSSETLVFTARRLRADRVAMIFAAREGEERSFQAPGLPSLSLGPLDEPSAAAILDQQAGGAASAVRRRLLTEAQGNPLALMELPIGLADTQLAGADPLPDAIPLTPRLLALFRQRIERLPAPTQTALLIAASDESGELGPVLQAGAQLGLDQHALDPAERSELVRIDGDRIVFRHPLVRAALQENATASSRQRVHLALATALQGDENADRRVWHQAMATLSADEEVAAALEAAARRARARAAHASAASAAWDAGQPDRARAAIARVLMSAGGELRAQLLLLNGVIESRTGDVHTALRLLVECAEQTADSSLKLEALGEAAEAVSFAGEYERAVDLGRLAETVQPHTDRDSFLVSLLTLMAAVVSADHDRASSALEQVVTHTQALDDPRGLIWAASALWAAPELAGAVDYAARAADLARQRGLVSLLPLALQYQATAEIARNRFDRAHALAQEGYDLAQDTGQTWAIVWHLASLSAVELVRGQLEASREHAETVLALGRNREAPFLIAIAVWRLGQIALVAGRHDEATDQFLRASETGGPESHPMIALRMIPEVVEAAVAAGREAEVRERFERYDEWVSRWPTRTHVALRWRTLALLDPANAEEHFNKALAGADAIPALSRARTELLYGEWLRRERRRQDARRHLRVALELFRQVGAVLREERAAAELRATGETARKRDASTLDELTPAGAPDRRLGRGGPDQPRDRVAAVPEPAHDRLPPAQGVQQARNHLAHPARSLSGSGPRPGWLSRYDWRLRRCDTSCRARQWPHACEHATDGGDRRPPSGLSLRLLRAVAQRRSRGRRRGRSRRGRRVHDRVADAGRRDRRRVGGSPGRSRAARPDAAAAVRDLADLLSTAPEWSARTRRAGVPAQGGHLPIGHHRAARLAARRAHQLRPPHAQRCSGTPSQPVWRR
jgi:hypothetical protein